MTEAEEKGIGKTKVGLIVCAVLVIILAISSVWLYTRVDSLQNQINTLETDKNNLQSQVSSLQTDKSTLEGQLTSLQSRFITLNASYVTLNADYNEMSLRFKELSINYSDLTENFGLLREDCTTLNVIYTELVDVFNQLAEDHENLTSNYNALSENHSSLLSTHQTLQEQYFALNALYQQLQTDYETLENTYNILSGQYETLLELWNEPLEYVVTPTWDEVTAWLEIDQTNATSYDPEKFLCGDFSIMLIQHAKAMHWRMLYTVIEFDYYDENPTEIERHHGNHAHGFVSIFTAEGIVYIEPQTDFTWHLYLEGDPETHVEFSEWEFVDFGEDWFGHVFVQYYGRMGANVEPIEDSPASIEVGVPH